MTTKSYLGQIERLDRMIQNKLQELDHLRAMSTAIKSTTNVQDVKVQTSIEPDKLADSVAKIVDMEREIDAMVDRFVDRKKHIIKQLDSMDNNDYYHVLYGIYVLGKTNRSISIELSRCESNIKKIHKKAITEFENRFGTEYL